MMLSIFEFHTSMTNWQTILFRTNSNFKWQCCATCYYKIWSVDAEWLASQVVNDAAISTPIIVAVNDGVKEGQNKQKFT